MMDRMMRRKGGKRGSAPGFDEVIWWRLVPATVSGKATKRKDAGWS